MLRLIVQFVLLTFVGVGLLAVGSHLVHSGRPPVPEKPEGTLRIATLNTHWIALRQTEGPWSPAGWRIRRPAMSEALTRIAPDIVALQEAESFPSSNRDGTNLVVEGLSIDLPHLAVAASGGPTEFPSTQPILYARERFELIDQGWFFFSETPDVIYSRTFNGSWPAFASWAEFRERSGGPAFRVVNIHTDFSSRSNRRLSAALIRDRIAPWIANDVRVVVLGDLNAMRGAKTLRLIEDAGITFPRVRGATFHLNRGVNLFGAIDHIGHSAGLTLSDPRAFRTPTGDVWPSDHYPIYSDVTFEN